MGYLLGYVASFVTDRKKPLSSRAREYLKTQLTAVQNHDITGGSFSFCVDIMRNRLIPFQDRGYDVSEQEKSLYELTHKPLPKTATQDLDHMLSAIVSPGTSEPSSFTTEMMQERLKTYHQQGFVVSQYQTRLDKLTASLLSAKESKLEKAANIDLTLPPPPPENVKGH